MENEYFYKNADGTTAFVVHRYINNEGRKSFFAYSVDEKGVSTHKHIPERYKAEGVRPLYNLLSIKDKENILVVEGEKTADAAAQYLPDDTWGVVTWSGGTQAVAYTDWSPIKGKHVVLWPDNDRPGRMAMNKINGDCLSVFAIMAFTILVDNTFPEKWDLADELPEGITPEIITSMIKDGLDQVKIFERPSAVQPDGLITNSNVHYLPGVEPTDVSSTELHNDKTEQFRCLGYDEENLYIMCANKDTIVKTSIQKLSRLDGLQAIVPSKGYWENTVWPAASKASGRPPGTKMEIPYIAEFLARECYKEGIFTREGKMRGRGCWADNGELIVHLGGRLIVGGLDARHWQFRPSKYIYEKMESLMEYKDEWEPLSAAEGEKIIAACIKANWRYDIYASLYAGWLVNSLICGALKWRPHIWVTGNKGCGKTELYRQVAKRVLGNIGVYVVGQSTEAGIRGVTEKDSRPVCFDEAEGMDAQSMSTIKRVIGLIRISSSNNTGVMLKGTAAGGSTSFELRSMFYLSSIGDTIQLGQDRERITVLNIRGANEIPDIEEREIKYVQFMQAARELDKIPHLAARLLKRIIQRYDIHAENIENFITECTKYFKSRRHGDQIGTLLAGRWILTNDGIASNEDILKIIRVANWTEIKGSMSEPSEDIDIVNNILSADIRCELKDGKSAIRKVAELMLAIRGRINIEADELKITKGDAVAILNRNGIKMTDTHVKFGISNTGYVSNLLVGSAYELSWPKILRRHPTATYNNTMSRFGGVGLKYIMLPIESVLGGEVEDDERLTDYGSAQEVAF